MTMSQSNYTHAELVLRELGITDPQEIDVEAIAWYLGATVRYVPLDGCEARILGTDDRAIITVNSRSAPTRKRFSVAHELGHWKYHRGRITVCTSGDIESGDKGRKQDQERVADRFGADLLMPRYLVQPAVGKVEFITWKLVKTIAEQFSTSPIATVLRLVDLNLIPSLVVCHNKEGRVWFARSKDVPDRWFPNNELSPESLAFDLVYSNGGTVGPRRVPANAWFDRNEAYRYELTEESVATGYGDVISILSITNEQMLEDY